MKLNKENMIVAGNKIYGICLDCGKLVRINKPIIGSVHICLTEEEKALKQQREKKI